MTTRPENQSIDAVKAKPTAPIGDRIAPREYDRHVRGAGRFTNDIPIDNPLSVAFVRSDVANAPILSIRSDDARELPGVVAVYTAADIGITKNLSVNAMLEHHKDIDFPILAADSVAAVGQPIVAVVATDMFTAQDAAEAVEIEYGEQAEPNQSSKPTETTNAAFSQRWQCGDVRTAFDNADFIVDARLDHPRLAPSPMETRAITVRYESNIGNAPTAAVWLSTQTPHRARTELAKILGIDANRLRVIAADVGGAFGMKASLYPEEILIVWAALELQRPLRWQASRSEDFLSATHGRGTDSQARLALSKNGKLLALQADITAPLGHWLPTSASVPAWNAARILPGPYQIANLDIATRAVTSPTAAVGIYRGAGRPEAAALLERLLDQAATCCGIDPIELRRNNMHAPAEMPVTLATGAILDSGNYAAALNELKETANYQVLREHVNARRAAGELVGLGIAFYVEPSGQGWESARVTWHPDNTVDVATGGSSQGHSRETALAQVTASILPVPISAVTVYCGDTATCPAGIGALASRSTPIGASAVWRAALAVREKAGQQIPPAESITADDVFDAPGEAWGYGCTLAVVSIDSETGELTVESLHCVDDAGTIVNPDLARGQLLGGIAQGLGEAQMEQIQYDETGQLITGSLLDYALPRADNMPSIHIQSVRSPSASPVNPLGAKGLGEAGTIATPAAILNAVHNALKTFDTVDLSMPLTSEKLWRIINR